jgi:hypothetical protein
LFRKEGDWTNPPPYGQPGRTWSRSSTHEKLLNPDC